MPRFSVLEDPPFQRAIRLISSITNSRPATIVTTIDHNYETGDIVRIRVPQWFGMRQIDKLYGPITVTGSDSFTIDIDTSQFDTFSVPAPIPFYVNEYASVIPIGEIAANLGGATKNAL